MAPPSEIKAIVIAKPGLAEVQTVNLPALREDYILVRTTAVGLNPTDWKHTKGIDDNTGCRAGCDYAGIVQEVGSKVTKAFAPGDRICGFAHGGNSIQPEDGTFAEYIVVKGDIQIKIPDNLSDEEAATLGVGISTLGQGLYQKLKLPLPLASQREAPTPKPLLFIYGGSTATGILGIQYASLSGYSVLTTSSSSNMAYIKSLGASLVVDYHSPSAIEEVKEWVASHNNGALTIVWDCIGGADSSRFCASVLANPPHEGTSLRYGLIARGDEEIIKSINPFVTGLTGSLAYTMIGERFGGNVPGSQYAWAPVPEDLEFGKMFWELSRGVLAEGRVKAARTDVNRGGKGLEGVLVGMKEMEEGKVRGVKLVYTL